MQLFSFSDSTAAHMTMMGAFIRKMEGSPPFISLRHLTTVPHGPFEAQTWEKSLICSVRERMDEPRSDQALGLVIH
jgi:hypothetical protein